MLCALNTVKTSGAEGIAEEMRVIIPSHEAI